VKISDIDAVSTLILHCVICW